MVSSRIWNSLVNNKIPCPVFHLCAKTLQHHQPPVQEVRSLEGNSLLSLGSCWIWHNEHIEWNKYPLLIKFKVRTVSYHFCKVRGFKTLDLTTTLLFNSLFHQSFHFFQWLKLFWVIWSNRWRCRIKWSLTATMRLQLWSNTDSVSRQTAPISCIF